jgi:hypothetical protein
MSQRNPFKTSEGEENSTETDQNPEQSGDGEPNQEVTELKEEVRGLREETKRLRQQMEPEPPEPDYECEGEDCEGFAVEEVEPEQVTTQSGTIGSSSRPETVECPRCEEEMSPEEFVPKEEQRSVFGTKPLASNAGAAGRGLEQRFEEEGRERVLKEAEES